jgi:hypothetical protein
VTDPTFTHSPGLVRATRSHDMCTPENAPPICKDIGIFPGCFAPAGCFSPVGCYPPVQIWGQLHPWTRWVTMPAQGAPVPARGVFCDVNQRILHQYTWCVSCRAQAQNTLSHGAPILAVTGCICGCLAPSKHTVFRGFGHPRKYFIGPTARAARWLQILWYETD